MEFLNIFNEGKQYRNEFYSLYQEAFPEAEKKPEALMEALTAQGKMEMLAITEEQRFIGLVINMLAKKAALLDYFAISPDIRSGGYGGRAIQKLLERFQGQKYIFEIEMQDETAPNAEDRRRRKKFYLRNGLKETGILANVYQTDFELLTPDGELTYEEYTDTLRDVLGEEGVRILAPSLIREK